MVKPDRNQRPLWQFDLAWHEGTDAGDDAELMRECAALFSGHYGKWGSEGPRPGQPVVMRASKVADLLRHPDARLATARYDGELVGYAAALRMLLDGDRRVVWVTQLVVHGAYRNARVATHMLYSIWHFSDCWAYGLVTANPLAVRALETATRRACRPKLIVDRAKELLPPLAAAAPYIPEALVSDDEGRPTPRVDTEFFVSRDDMHALRDQAARGNRPWALGDIGGGEEWFAATFGDQDPSPMTEAEISELLRGADDIWIHAYELMTLDEDHRWRAHTQQEMQHILGVTGVGKGRVLDVGCGDGRHTAALAAAGFDVIGAEIAPALVATTREKYGSLDFRVVDARREVPDGPFDLVLCLYDVLGSSAEAHDDRRILANLHAATAPGGWLALSVMNDGAIADKIAEQHRPSSHQQFVRALEQLTPSRHMETTGSVFDPEAILAFDGVYYRKEQFLRPGAHLPTELVVRDRRFTGDQLHRLVDDAGFTVESIAPVQAGEWDRRPELAPSDSRAKEWLVIARKADTAAPVKA